MPSPRRAAIAVFIFVLGAYGYFFNGGGWNQNAQFALTRSIVEQGSFEISAYPGTEDVGYIDGRVYANKLPGPSFIAAIPYALLYGSERLIGVDPAGQVPMQVNAYLCTLIVCGVPGALIGALLVIYGARIARSGVGFASLVALTVCFGTPLFAYSTVFYRHVPVGAFLLLAFVLSSRRFGRSLVAGLCAGMAGLSSYLAMPILVLLVVRAGVSTGWRQAGRFVLGGLPSAALLAWYQISTTSSLFTITAAQNEQFTTEGALLGFLSLPSPAVLSAILFGEHRGLLFLSPFLLLIIPGLWRIYSRREFASLVVICGTIVWLLLFNASFNGWHGGWSIGPRYLSEGLPLAALALMHLPKRIWAVIVGAITGSISVLLNFVAAAVDPQPPLSVLRPFRDYLLPVLASGMPWSPPGSDLVFVDHVNVGPVALDGTLWRWSSFNLGELITRPGELLSLLPVVVWMLGAIAVCSVWSVREAAEHDRS